MMKRRLQSNIPASTSGSRRNGLSRRKKSCFLVACVVVGVLFSIRRTLHFQSTLNQWSYLSTVMTETYGAAENSGSFLGGANTNATVNATADSPNRRQVIADLRMPVVLEDNAATSHGDGDSIGSDSDGSSSASNDQSSDENREKPESLNDDSDEIIVSNRTVLFMRRPEIQDGDP
jgi:hypothetical protein